MPQESIDLFVENLLSQAKLNLPADFKGQYVEKLKEQINRRLGLVIMENLDDAGLEEFSRLMATEPKPDINTIQAAFQARIPDFEQKIKEALVEFAQDFVNLAEK
ncbi:MAG: DUF5663 domain-containing protein [Patescibacteria group bacterium]